MSNSESEAGDPKNNLSDLTEEQLRAELRERRFRREAKWSWTSYFWFTFLFLIAVLIFLGVISQLPDDSGSGRKIYENPDFPLVVASIIVAVPVLTALFQVQSFVLQKLVYTISIANAGVAEANEKASRLQDNLGDDFVTNLVKINFKYIDQYYLQTQRQADRSFSVSLWVSVVGFIIIAVGILLAIFQRTESAYITTGAGVLSEFIAAVFFYLYNRTIQSMGSYHRKLVITQNIALALKISESLPIEQRSDAQVGLVATLTSDVNNLLAFEERVTTN